MNFLAKFLFFAMSFLCQFAFAMESNGGVMYWKSIKCGAIKADLMVNHRTVAQPTILLNSTRINLEEGPDYWGPVCVTYRGKKKIGYVESMGNAYSAYYIIDIETFKVTEIDYQTAHKIGFGL